MHTYTHTHTYAHTHTHIRTHTHIHTLALLNKIYTSCSIINKLSNTHIYEVYFSTSQANEMAEIQRKI